MDEPLSNVEPLDAADLRPIDVMVLAGAVAVARAGQAVTLPNVAAALNAPAGLLGCLYRIEPIVPPSARPLPRRRRLRRGRRE